MKFKKPEMCDECGEELEQFFIRCRTCNKCICYNCFFNHKMEHDYLPCETLDDNTAIVIDVGDGGGYGPRIDDLWPATDFDSFISDYYDRCPHAIDYFKKNNITFLCHQCGKWICLDCLNDHSGHDLMLHVGFNNGKELRQIDPNLYNSYKELVLATSALELDNGNIKVGLAIGNANNVPLYNLRVMCTWKGLDHGDVCEEIDEKWIYCLVVTEIEMIPSKEMIEMTYELPINDIADNKLSNIITIVRFKDVFLSNGRAIDKSDIKYSKEILKDI